jgi:hypothetical protein
LDKTIVTAFLVIAGVISVVFMFNALYPAVVDSSNAMLGMERRIDDRLTSQIAIVHATGDGSNARIWIKNVGSSSIKPVNKCDLFFGKEGAFVRIPYKDESGVPPYWEYTIINDGDPMWKPTETLSVVITTGGPVLSGRYFVKMALPNGVSDETYFSQ